MSVPDQDRSINSNRIHIDARLNKGQSGGPLFNLRGEVVGIVSVGIENSFATPSNTITKIVRALRTTGEIRKGWMGLATQSVTPSVAKTLGMDVVKGVLVAVTTPDSPAERAGLKSGDVIVEVNGRMIDSPRGLVRLISQILPGTSVKINLVRDSVQKTVPVVIGEAPRDANLWANSQTPPVSTTDVFQELGLTVEDLSPKLRTKYRINENTKTGIVITKVQPNSHAASEGLKPGQVISEVGARPVDSVGKAQNLLTVTKNSGRDAVVLQIQTAEKTTRFVALRFSAISTSDSAEADGATNPKSSESTWAIVERVRPAVVSVSAITKFDTKGDSGRASKNADPLKNLPKDHPLREFIENLPNEMKIGQEEEGRKTQGSGFVIDSSGLILTAAHVVDGADEIVVTLHDGTKLESTKVVGTDPKTDIALVKVESSTPLQGPKFRRFRRCP